MLKIKDDFILSRVANQNIVLSTAEELNLDHVMTMNETGRFLWERLEQGTTEDALVEDLLREYNVTETKARDSVQTFLQKLRDHNVLA